MKLTILRNSKGFTLIELMIVVGIIGILVSIAAPNFAKYQSKARQAESKIALAAVYTGEKSFYSEYSAYISSLDAVGYAPEGQRRFYAVGWSAPHATTVTGYAGQTTNAFFSYVNAPYTCTGFNGGSGSLPAPGTGDVQSFTVGAVGCIRSGATSADAWNITDTKILSNNVIGL